MQGILTLLEERVTLRTLLAVMSGLIVSIFLLYVGSQKSWWIGRKCLADSPPASQVFAFHAGLTIVWELTEEPGGTATIKSGCGFRYREARREAIRHTTARLQGAALESVDALREI
jgi:hypothetical protein